MGYKRFILIIILVLVAWQATLIHAQDTEYDSQASEAGGDNTKGSRENDQTVVAGFGWGRHFFDQPLVLNPDGLSPEARSIHMLQLFAEWYPYDRLGVGLRIMTGGKRLSHPASYGTGSSGQDVYYEGWVLLHSRLLTVHWVPLEQTRLGNLGLLAGVGTARYQFVESVGSDVVTDEHTRGPASLAGAYWDWGGKGFGVRSGIQFLRADLGDLTGRPMEVSGSQLFLDLRWAFPYSSL